MIDMEALVSIKSSTFLSIRSGFCWCKCCKNPSVLLIMITLLNFKFSSYFLLASFTMFSKCFNSLGIEIIVSIGDNEILPLMRCVNFFYLEEPSFISSIGSNSMALSFVASVSIFAFPHAISSLASKLQKNVMFSPTYSIQLFQNSHLIIN